MLYLTIRQIEYVVAVAKAGSLTAAAEILNVSQPSLSVSLSQLEARLGQRLFARRKGARVRLTVFGEDYVQQAEALLALARRLDDPAVSRLAVEGTLLLGCFQDLAPSHLAHALQVLRRALPAVDLRWRVADFATLAREMIDGRIDISITYDLGLDSGFERIPFGEAVPHAFVGESHPLAGRDSVSLRELAGHALILFEEGLSVRHVLGLFRQVERSPVVSHRVAALEVMRSLAAIGDGVGISYTVPPGDRSYGQGALAATAC